MHVLGCVHMCTCMKRPEVSLRYHPSGAPHLCSLAQGLTDLELVKQIRLSGQGIPREPVWCLSGPRTPGICHHTWTLMWPRAFTPGCQALYRFAMVLVICLCLDTKL